MFFVLTLFKMFVKSLVFSVLTRPRILHLLFWTVSTVESLQFTAYLCFWCTVLTLTVIITWGRLKEYCTVCYNNVKNVMYKML